MERLLVIGGKPRNIPWNKITCSIDQMDCDNTYTSRGTLSFPSGQRPTLILCLKDFISHAVFNRFKAGAKELGIPFVASSGGFNRLINEAKERGWDMTAFIRNGEETPMEPSNPVVAETAENVTIQNPRATAFNARVKENLEWIESNSPTAKALVVAGTNVLVQTYSTGTSLVLKQDVLKMVLSLVRNLDIFPGRIRLNKKEATHIAEVITEKYELDKNFILPVHPTNVIKNVARALMSREEAAEHTERIRNYQKKHNDKVAATREAIEKNKTVEEPTKATKEREPAKAEASPKIMAAAPVKAEAPPQAKARVIKEPASEDSLNRISALYERILDLTKENSSFIEQISALEASVKQRDSKIKDLEDKIRILTK